MKNFCAAITLILISALSAYAGKWSTGTTAPAACTVGDSWTDTNGAADNRFYTCTTTNTWTLNSNQTAIDAKANRTGSVMLWSEWANGASFAISSPPVAYNGSLYKCIAPYTKVAGETPNMQTEYFSEVTGTGGGIAHAPADGNFYASKNNAWASLTGAFAAPLGTDDNYITDTEKIKLAGIAEGSEVNVNADWNASSGDAQILNKPTIPTVSDTAYGAGWNGDTGAASKNALYDKIETIAGGSMTYPGAGVPISTGTAWGTSITPGAGVSAALGYAPNSAGGFLLYSTYASDPIISWDTATITETVDNPVAGTNKISVKANTFQAYDANMILWPSAINATEVGYLDGLSDTLSNLLSTKQPIDADLTTASGATGSGNSKYFGTNSTGVVGYHDLPSSGGVGGYVTLSAIPYSDVPCTTGQYGYYGSTAYLCTGGYWVSKWELTSHTNASPSSGFSDDFGSDTSANYTAVTGGLSITSGVAEGTANYANNYIVHETSTASANHFVQADIKFITSNGSGVVVGASAASSSATGYVVAPVGLTTVRLWSFNGATDTDTGKTWTVSLTDNVFATMKVIKTGTTFALYVNGTHITPDITDSTYTNGQYAGIAMMRYAGYNTPVDNLSFGAE